jgi:type IV pilus assembly protein PilA
MVRRTRRIVEACVGLLPVAVVIALPQVVRTPTFSREMAGVKAITTIHTAETQYYAQYGEYAKSLAQLGPPASGTPGPNGAGLIDKDLASGRKAGFEFVLRQTQAGYSVSARPVGFARGGAHTYFSDESMSIHQHEGEKPATVGDPLLGDPLRGGTAQRQRSG